MITMKKHQITLQQSGTTLPCAENQFVLAAMRQAQQGPHGCHGGGCGVCKMQVLQGRYQVVKRMSNAHISQQEQAQNVALMCCIQPLSNLVIGEVQR